MPAITPAPLIVHMSKCQQYASAVNQLYPVSALQYITSKHFNFYQSTVVRKDIPQRLPKAQRASMLTGMLSIFCPLFPWIKSKHQKRSDLKQGEFPSLGRYWHYALCQHKRFSKKKPPVIYWDMTIPHFLMMTRCLLYEDPREKFLLGHSCVASDLQNTKKIVTNRVFLQLLRNSEPNLHTTSSCSCVLTLCPVWFDFPPLFPIALISAMTQRMRVWGREVGGKRNETRSSG